jgi:hypothetical protein
MNIIDFVNKKLSQFIGLAIVLFICSFIIYIVMKRHVTDYKLSIVEIFTVASFILVLALIAFKIYYVINFGAVLTGASFVINKFQIPE